MKILNSLAERFGLNAYAVGRFDLAEKWFRRLEKVEGESIRVLRNLGVISLAKGDVKTAERYLRREEKLYGATYRRHRALADLCYTSLTREEAAKRYAAALEDEEAKGATEEERVFLQTRLAICMDIQRFESSREGALLFAKGTAAGASGDSDEALKNFLAAAELDPTNWPALNNAGVILLSREGGAAKALELFEKAAACARVPMITRNIALAKDALQKGSARASKETGRTRKSPRT
jgi:Flp pilus assembly protein TadD